MLSAYNNRAMAKLKLQDWEGALEDCASVLQEEPNNVKALLRQASARWDTLFTTALTSVGGLITMFCSIDTFCYTWVFKWLTAISVLSYKAFLEEVKYEACFAAGRVWMTPYRLSVPTSRSCSLNLTTGWLEKKSASFLHKWSLVQMTCWKLVVSHGSRLVQKLSDPLPTSRQSVVNTAV